MVELESKPYPAADGITLSCIDAGPENGPLVILLHGFPEDAQSWSDQIAALAGAGFRVLAPDQRGYGASDKPGGVKAYRLNRLGADVAALAATLGRERFDLVGHDWGGVVAWWMAIRYAERVRRLVIVNAPHPDAMASHIRRSPVQVLRSSYIALFQIPRLAEFLLSADDFRLLGSTLRRSSRPGAFSDAVLARYKRAWSEPGALTAMLNWYRALRLKTGSSPSLRVRAPTLILWGARDLFLGRGLAAASAAMCDASQLVYFEEATHWLLHEEGERVNASLIAFLKD